LDEESTKILEEEICKKVEESLNTDEVKSEMLFRIEEGHQNLINGVTLQLQKEKEDKIQEGHHKIHEEVEFHLEDVHAKYDGIISKARTIKEKSRKIEDSIVSENNLDEIHRQSEEKPSKVEPY
jgi:arginine/glutamate-rich protein 1